jgi:hypothetical protein
MGDGFTKTAKVGGAAFAKKWQAQICKMVGWWGGGARGCAKGWALVAWDIARGSGRGGGDEAGGEGGEKLSATRFQLAGELSVPFRPSNSLIF